MNDSDTPIADRLRAEAAHLRYLGLEVSAGLMEEAAGEIDRLRVRLLIVTGEAVPLLVLKKPDGRVECREVGS